VHLPKTHIHLRIQDSTRSTAFYQALLGGPPASRSADAVVFDFERPSVLLVLELRAPPREAENRGSRRLRRPKGAGPPPGTSGPNGPSRYALVVPDPEHVGRATVALWRTGAPLRLQDQGIETLDPDGNAWKVRFVPFARGPAVLAVMEDGKHARC
jgi:catechol 2,3-dioxygenase-like lactoylglutathione lyase family enzyme